ncbi:hypothetical protein BH09ACT3_BH09ACT3_02640 [soil metagenome]
MRLNSVLSSIDLPTAELDAARLDGELFRIDGCFAPIDEPDRAALRAGSLAARFSPRLIAEQRSAAWVLGVLDAPPRTHQLCAALDSRVRPADLSGIEVREVVIEETDLLSVGGFRITSVLRTVIDLARFSPTFGSDEMGTVRGLAELGAHCLADYVAQMERRRNLPGKRRAIERLRLALT